MGTMRQLRRELRACVGQPIAYQIGEGRGAALAETLEQVIRGGRVRDGDFYLAATDTDLSPDDRRAESARLSTPIVVPAGRGGKATALVSVRGIALYDTEFQPVAFSTLHLAQTVTALANDPEIGTIVLDIDSPGGVVTGVQEASDAIFKARETTRVVALVNPLAASAAYHIASQAQEIVTVPSGEVGSIGVYSMHADCSGAMDAAGIKPTLIFAGKYKVEGNMFEPLSDEARDHIQTRVNAAYQEFVRAVARGRGVSVAKVEADFGQGRTMKAEDARRVGMVDRIATINAAFARWGLNATNMDGRGARRALADDDSAPVAVETDPLAEYGPAREPEDGFRDDNEPVETADGGDGMADREDAEIDARRRRMRLSVRRRRLALRSV